MRKRPRLLKIVVLIIVILVSILIVINVAFIKTSCSTRECLVINVATILLLIWATAFWLVVLKYSKREKDKGR
ncbi:MAG: hypothetical protein KJ957_07805 [Candidatus Omnitrophica bacterium]|nr:hypothetical protein [Candidatus Omnitrophota bacterium]